MLVNVYVKAMSTDQPPASVSRQITVDFSWSWRVVQVHSVYTACLLAH